MQATIRIISCPFLLALTLAGCGSSSDPDVGGLRVTVTTDGGSADPDGYTVQLEGRSSEPIAVNGSVTFPELAPGTYTARLSGVAPNCFVAGANPVTLEVRAGSEATAAFSVSCPLSGARVKVTTESTGDDYDANGYLLKIGSALPKRISARGTTIVAAEAEGTLPIELTDIAANCTADATNPATVAVAENHETPLALRFACTNINGAIKVVVAATGVDYQTTGFEVTLDALPVTLAANNTAIVGRLLPGPHTLTLSQSSLQPNCQLAGTNPRTVNVALADTTEAILAVTCTALPKVVFAVTTTGTAFDTDGYSITLYDPNDYYYGTSYVVNVPANGSVRGPVMPAGTYQAYVSNNAPNCGLVSLSPNPVTLGRADVTLTLTVRCDAARQLAFVTGIGTASEINVGSEIGASTQLTHNAVADSNPAWSPDGQQLAFTSARDGNSEIYVMNADGSSVRRLTNSASADYQPTWSSDGTMIAFVSERDGNPEIYAMDATGANPVRLTTNSGIDQEPSWSPSGNRIVFGRGATAASAVVHVMNADGSGVTDLGTGGNREASPVWSPTGAQVAFVRMDAPPFGSLRIMNVDGSDVHDRQLYNIGPHISWSPDDRIAFVQPSTCDYYTCYDPVIRILRGDGSVSMALPWLNPSEPAWRP